MSNYNVQYALVHINRSNYSTPRSYLLSVRYKYSYIFKSGTNIATLMGRAVEIMLE